MKQQNKKEDYKGWCSRSAVLDPKIINEDKRSIRTLITTEEPALVVDWTRWEIIREVLLMKGCELPQDDYLVMLDNHSRWGGVADVIKGSLNSLKTEADQFWGDSVFSSIAEKEWTLAKEGHLKAVSVGYKTYEDASIIISPGQKQIVEGKEYENNYGDKRNLIIRTKWEPKECSLVPIGADKNAGFKSLIDNLSDDDLKEFKARLGIPENIPEPEIKNEPENKTDNNNSIIKMENNKMDPEVKTPEQLAAEKAEAERTEKARVDEITSLGKAKNLPYEFAVKNNLTIEQYRGFVIEQLGGLRANANTQLFQDPADIELSKQEIKSYSFFRAIQAITDKNYKCFERELSDEIAQKSDQAPKGIFVPYRAFMKNAVLSQRDVTVGGTGTGAELVGTTHMGGSFIDILRNKMLSAQLGVPTMTGLRGNIAIPKLLTGSTFAVAASETGSIAESTPTTGQVTMSPKRGGTYVDVSNQLMLQSDPSVEQVLISDLIKACALGVDYYYFLGSGASGQPYGVINTTGVNSITGTDFNRATALSYIEKVMEANADVASMAFCSSPEVWALLKDRPKLGTWPVYLIDDQDKMEGYPFKVSQQLYDATNKYILFGDYSQSMIGFWGGVDLIVDPYTQATTGLKRLVVELFFDVAVRIAAAFSKSTAFS